METFFIADTHFNHTAILKHTNRNFKNIEDMNVFLIKKWNAKVKKGDRVFVLGDFAFSHHSRFLSLLHGKKHLIIGNHDKMSLDVMRNFTSVNYYKEIKIDKKYHFILTHYCMRTWSESINGSINLFGHSHGRLKTYNLSFDVGVDCNNYEPLHVSEIIAMVEKRKEEMKLNGRIIKEKKKLIYLQDDVHYLNSFLRKNK